MSVRTLKAKGFTLVEILIVVVILGILAAIVIPQFTSASESAKLSSTVTQLQSLRSQLELYQLEHNGNYPGTTPTTSAAFVSSADFWADLTGETDVSGAAATSSTTKSYGPYLQKEITNPFTDAVAVAGVNTDPLPTTGGGAGTTNGFVYNFETGEIKAGISTAKQGDLDIDLADDDFITY